VINFYDTSAVKALVDARRASLASNEAYERKMALEALRASAIDPHPARRAVGRGLIRIGARLSGIGFRDLRRVEPECEEVCVPI
jgi:hypothetical protein